MQRAIVVKPGLYRHYAGTFYDVLGVALHSEKPQELFVVYRQLRPCKLRESPYKLLPTGTMWARPLSLFVQHVVDAKGTLIPRFRRIEGGNLFHK